MSPRGEHLHTDPVPLNEHDATPLTNNSERQLVPPQKWDTSKFRGSTRQE